MPSASALPDWLSVDRLTRWRAAIAVAAGRGVIAVRAPFTGAPLPSVPRGEADDVQGAVAAARRAQAAWADVPVRRRAHVLLRLHDLVLARADEAMDLVQIEAGKARLDAFEEVADTANVARHYGIHAPALLGDRRRKGALPLLTSTTEARRPRGVVGCIVPWNYPLNLALTDAIAALVAGNAVVLRPDPQTTLTTLWGLEQLREAGLPDGVLTVVTGEGPDIGPALVEAVDFAMFTGSSDTGRRVATTAAPRLIDVSLELGGKNPMIVRHDADPASAARAAVRGAFVGAGQVCVSIERVYVHDAIASRFLEAFIARTAGLRFCTGLGWDGDVGTLVNERQLARVVSHVEDARTRGATVHAGGRARPDLGPFFYEPTILGGVTPAMTAHATETFGPVVAVYRVGSDDEAVSLANGTPYGLTACVFTRDVRAGRVMASRLRCGSVGINDPYAAAWGSVDSPVGGMKDSGIGRRHGREGLLKFTEAQTVAVQRLWPLGPPETMSPRRYAALLRRALKLRRHIPGVR